MNHRLLYAISFYLVLCASCEIRTYVQPTPNISLLEEKNDFRANLHADLGNMLSGLQGGQFQLAYSPLSNIGTQLNAHWDIHTGQTSIRNWDENNFGMWHFEGALGYYRSFDRNYFSFYSGYGRGYLNETKSFSEFIFNSGDRTTRASFGKFDKYFFQLSYWYKLQPWLDIGICYRRDDNYFKQFAFIEIVDPKDELLPSTEFFFERSPYRLHVGNFICNLRFDLGENAAFYIFMGRSDPITINEFHFGRPFAGYTLQLQLSHSESHREWVSLKRKRKTQRRKARQDKYLKNLKN